MVPGEGELQPQGLAQPFGGANIRESRDLSNNLGNLQHNRSYSMGAVITRSARWSFDFNYNYDDLLTNINICFVETPTPAFANTSGALCGAAYLSALSFYHDISNFGSADLMFKPVAARHLHSRLHPDQHERIESAAEPARFARPGGL